ncbi:hypothetical protein PFDG_05125 [Plasmodium falciparum Dd2]|uniref:Uncharacterized protein n=1 Tax=Plasmodium falciparum (isolate Dd2) TaxID=57267 RepID=A0A0L7M9U4_PLAF4|nr:hypothetical protein PFDG_05125 [Plasmodium falciparum Dd2]
MIIDVQSDHKNDNVKDNEDTNVISLDSKYNVQINVINFILHNRNTFEISNNPYCFKK